MTGDREALLRPATWCRARAKWRTKGWARGLADRGVEDMRRTSLPPFHCLELAWSLGSAKPRTAGLSHPSRLQRELRRVPAPPVRGEKSGCLLPESRAQATDLLYVLCQERKVMANLSNTVFFIAVTRQFCARVGKFCSCPCSQPRVSVSSARVPGGERHRTAEPNPSNPAISVEPCTFLPYHLSTYFSNHPKLCSPACLFILPLIVPRTVFHKFCSSPAHP